MYPCLIVPTSDLFIGNERPSVEPVPLIVTKTPLIYTTKKELDEKTGLSILSYLYNSKSLFGDDEEEEGTIDAMPHTDADFFGSLPERKRSETEPTLFQKSKMLFNLYPKCDNIRFIDKWFLKKHKLTIRILLAECDTEITNLKKAGIVNNYDDLCELGFDMTDLVFNRTLFNAGHMVQLFDMDASTLDICVDDLRHCHFTPAELMTLRFSLPDLIETNGLKARHLLQLGYNLSSLRQLGLNRAHLKQLGITMPIAINTFKWSPKEVNEML